MKLAKALRGKIKLKKVFLSQDSDYGFRLQENDTVQTDTYSHFTKTARMLCRLK